VRHNGTPPTYTGAVYDVTVSATGGARVGPGVFAADGVLSLGGQSTATVGGAPLDVLRRRR
jgi:hypothetical protein